VLIIAIIALRHPNKSATAAGTDTRTSTSIATSGPASGHSSGSRSHSRSSSPTTSRPSNSAIGSEPLVVLNDSGTSGIGAQAAQRFRAGGWTVTSVDENYQNNIASTVAYYDPAVSGAQRAALALQAQFPAIKRVVEKFTELPAGPVVVVLTPDYARS
jgi:hypothetical protein